MPRFFKKVADKWQISFRVFIIIRHAFLCFVYDTETVRLEHAPRWHSLQRDLAPKSLNFKLNCENLQIESNPKSCELKSNLSGQIESRRALKSRFKSNRDSDLPITAENITTFFHSISADLPLFDFNCIAQLLSDIDVLPAELVTEPHSIEKSWPILMFICHHHQVLIKSLTGFCGTFLHIWLTQSVAYLIHPLEQESSLFCGSRLTLFLSLRFNRQVVLNLIYTQSL